MFEITEKEHLPIMSMKITVSPSDGRCQIESSQGNPWMDLAVIMEGLGVVLSKNRDSGRTEKELHDKVMSYFDKIEKEYKTNVPVEPIQEFPRF